MVRWSLHKYKCLWSVGGKGRVQVSRREFHTHIHLDLAIVKILSYIKKVQQVVAHMHRGQSHAI